MSGIFPIAADGGIPPSSDPRNPAAAFPPTVEPTGTAALYYGNGCDVRLRPEVVNSLISEVAATVDRAGLSYDPNKWMLELAIRYLIQRGLPKGTLLTGGQLDYQGVLDPAATGYNNFMELVVVPNVVNNGAVRLSLNGLAYVPVLRNDGTQLHTRDFPANIPVILVFWNGNFYVPYPVQSQIPGIMTQAVNVWIRTDGNDETGDGSSNDAAHAFRTINGAWRAVALRYATSPIFPLNLRLGIPGTYEAGSIGPYGGPVALYGDVAGKRNYRIASRISAPHICLTAVDASMMVQGVTCSLDQVSSYATASENGATLNLWDMEYEVNNTAAGIWYTVAGASTTTSSNHMVRGIGGVRNIGWVWGTIANSLFYGGSYGIANNISIYSLNFTTACVEVEDLSSTRFTNLTITSQDCTGLQWRVIGNSVLNRAGQAVPGSDGGVVNTGGQVI